VKGRGDGLFFSEGRSMHRQTNLQNKTICRKADVVLQRSLRQEVARDNEQNIEKKKKVKRD